MGQEVDLDFAPLSAPAEGVAKSDVLSRLIHGWVTLLVSVILGIVVLAIRTTIIEPVYLAKATIYFPTRSPSVLGQAGATEGAATAASVFGVGPTPIRVYRGFLESESALDHISAAMGEKRATLKGMRKFEEEASASTLAISATSRDKATALKVVQLHVDELGAINLRMGSGSLSDDVDVLTKELAKSKKLLYDAEQRSIRLQRQFVTAPSLSTSPNGVLALPGAWSQQLVSLKVQKDAQDHQLASALERVKVLAAAGIKLPSELPAIRKFRGILLKLQMDLKTRELILGPDATDIRNIKAEIRLNEEALCKELGDYVRGIDVGLLDPTVQEGSLPTLLASRLMTEVQISTIQKLASRAPTEATELTRVLRDVSIQGAIASQLTSQLAMAKLQAERDPNRWSLLDEPRIADDPVNKSYLRASIYGTIAGLFVGSIFVLFRTRRRS